MAKVVEAETVRETGDRTGPTPLAPEGGAPEGCALLPDEDQAVRPLLCEPGEMLPHLLVEEGREDDGPDTRVGFGLARSALAVGPFRLGNSDALKLNIV